jgi:GH18 family chitinase
MGMNNRILRFLLLLAAGTPLACSADAAQSVETSAVAVRRPVLCYVETLFGGVAATNLDFRPCTHVIEAFVVVDPSGAIRPVNGLPRRDLIAAARSAGAHVMVAIGGATVPGATFTAIARDPSRTAQFARAVADFVAQSGYDGVDLDWEFPTPAEANDHLALVRALRSALSGIRVAAYSTRRPPRRPPVTPTSPAILTVPVAGYWIPSFHLAALHDEVDYVILMGYDFRNPALGPWAHDAKLWPIDAQTPIEGSVRGAASEMIRTGVGYDKLVIAFPFYTSAQQAWTDVRRRALDSSSPIHPLYLEKLIDDVWITDPEALERKIRAALSGNQISGGNAAGIGVWQLGQQGTSRDLTESILRATTLP